jgi:hypothetical protein
MCQIIARLRIETSTGLASRVSTLAAARKVYGVAARTKAGALREMEALYERTYGWRYGERLEHGTVGR